MLKKKNIFYAWLLPDHIKSLLYAFSWVGNFFFAHRHIYVRTHTYTRMKNRNIKIELICINQIKCVRKDKKLYIFQEILFFCIKCNQ